MKLYIESYQTKIEELEKFEARWEKLDQEMNSFKDIKTKLEKQLQSVKNMHKEKKAEWKLKEQDLQQQIHKGVTQQTVLEEKVKELETFVITNRNIWKSEKGTKGDLILLKDESLKMNKNSKIKYLLKAIPSGSTQSNEELDDVMMNFSEMSTKIPEKSKAGSMKKTNPYKIDYFKNNQNSSDFT